MDQASAPTADRVKSQEYGPWDVGVTAVGCDHHCVSTGANAGEHAPEVDGKYRVDYALECREPSSAVFHDENH
jgi:hypothetical protein